MKMKWILLASYASWHLLALGQNYVGAGNYSGITVTASDAYQAIKWSLPANAVNTINGSGMYNDRFDAARFLNQASIGFEAGHINDVINLGKGRLD